MSDNIDNWQPLTPEEVRDLFAGLPVPWWIAGGWAIDLFAGRQTRLHGDIDVLILRDDQLDVQEFLSDWDLHKTQQPGLKPWPKGEFLNPGVNDIWCRRTPCSPWSLQFMLLDTQDGSWIFRRDSVWDFGIDFHGDFDVGINQTGQVLDDLLSYPAGISPYPLWVQRHRSVETPKDYRGRHFSGGRSLVNGRSRAFGYSRRSRSRSRGCCRGRI